MALITSGCDRRSPPLDAAADGLSARRGRSSDGVLCLGAVLLSQCHVLRFFSLLDLCVVSTALTLRLALSTDSRQCDGARGPGCLSRGLARSRAECEQLCVQGRGCTLHDITLKPVAPLVRRVTTKTC